jgi:hypothetical protein
MRSTQQQRDAVPLNGSKTSSGITYIHKKYFSRKKFLFYN